MNKKNWIKEYFLDTLFSWGGILVIAGVIVLCAYIVNIGLDGIFGYECVVEETGYYHSTNKASKCSFIKSAESNGFTIKKISQNTALDKGCKICKECFSHRDQVAYREMAAVRGRFDNFKKWFDEHKSEDLGWESLLMNANTDTNNKLTNLFVYIDSNSKLHISSCCWELAQDMNPQKISFDDVIDINTTCKECVGREYVDFIYKKVNDGIYDISLLGEPEE